MEGVNAFIDDILITSKSKEEHFQHFKALFERLDQYGLAFKPSECTLGVSNIEFLCFKISAEVFSPLPDRVDAIIKFPKPITITYLRCFLGIYNFYCRFLRNAAHISVPLIQLLEVHKTM